MLQALSDVGIKPDLLVGSSVGAINAAWVAGHPEPESLAELEEIWRGLTRASIFPVNPLLAAAAVMGRRNHLVDPAGLRHLLERHVSYRRLEEAEIPLHVVATDLLSGRPVLLSSGEALPALMASTAMPAVLPPVRIRGRDLVDGEVADYAPVSRAVALGADRVYVLAGAHPCAFPGPLSSALDMAFRAVNLMIESRIDADVERIGGSVEVHVLPHPCPLGVSPADFSQAGELIRRSRQTARRHLRAAHQPVKSSTAQVIGK